MTEKSSIKIMRGKGIVKVVLYTKPGCPLCERTEGILLLLSGLVEIDLEYIDISSDYSLFQKYQYDIPVLFVNGEEIARHRMNREKFLNLIRSIKV